MYTRLLIVIMLLLPGCAQPPQKELPVVQTAPVSPAAVAQDPAPVATGPVAAKRPQARKVVILVSDDIPTYNEVARALVEKLGQRGTVRLLNASQAENIKLLAQYKDDAQIQFVAVGLNAAIAAKALPDRQVVFCQVFNYQNYGLLTARHKGVSMLPSLSKFFGTWRALAPNATDIGMVSGPDSDDLVQAAGAAAKANGIKLHVETVRSDKEYEYVYKKIANDVQGYVLIPDNRVLSGNSLRNVMSFSVRNGKQVAVFSEDLLKLGALFSTTSDSREIARQVLDRLEKAQSEATIPGADMVYPLKFSLRINSVMVQRLNLRIPDEYRKFLNES